LRFKCKNEIMKLSGESKMIHNSEEKVFQLVSNCSHFGNYLPPDITGFEATETYCTFNMSNVAAFRIEITEKTPSHFVHFEATNDKHIPISLEIHISPASTGCEMKIELKADIPFFLQGMLKTPLQKFIDILSDRIQIEAEKL
jgi:hypothetical protein